MRETMTYGAILIMCLVLQSATLAVDFAAGTGEPNDPYQIATPEQLLAIGSDQDLMDKHYVLVADIDLDPNLPGGRVFTDALIAQDTSDDISGHTGASFEGVLDGQGHTIANMHIIGVEGYDAGLFGNLSGLVKALHLTGVVVSGSPCGAIAGLNHRGLILRCEVSGRLSGANDVGGLVGANWNGSLVECQGQVQVTGQEGIGGMVGGGPGGMLMRCRVQAEISGETWVGGLVGKSRGQIIECEAKGTVIGNSDVGGLVGNSRDTLILRSSADCEVTGQRGVGGLLGSAYSSFDPILVADSYARGSVAGSVVGGLVGQATDNRYLNCYAACEVIVLPVEGEEPQVGGLFGTGSPMSLACFWDAELSGVFLITGINPLDLGTGLTTEQLRDPGMLRDAGWDFGNVWTIGEGQYPRLQWQVDDSGDAQP